MQYKEIQQLLRYKQDELCLRLQSIKADFAKKEDLDDVLFTIAHETKVELLKVKSTLQAIEEQSYGKCQNCHSDIPIATLTKNPFQILCESCQNNA